MEEVSRKKIYIVGPLVITDNTREIAQSGEELFAEIGKQHGVDIVAPFITKGPTSIENEVDDALCIPETLRLGLQARDAGADGILVNCMCDPGVKALRCLLDIPVMGPAETAFHMAAALGHRFSVVDIGDDTGPMVEAQVHSYGLSDKFASIRGTGVGVEEIHGGDNLFTTMGAAALEAVLVDRADVIVLGCTGFIGCADAVKSYLAENGVTGVPVIDPLPLAIRTLIGVVMEGHCHSKRAFRTLEKSKSLVGAADDDALLEFYNQD
jgi:allantoin racemase